MIFKPSAILFVLNKTRKCEMEVSAPALPPYKIATNYEYTLEDFDRT